MSEYSNEPMVPGSGPEMSLVETWIAAFTKPKEDTYAKIAAQPSASASKAFLWVFLASLLTSLVSLVASLGGQMDSLRQFLYPVGGAPGEYNDVRFQERALCGAGGFGAGASQIQ